MTVRQPPGRLGRREIGLLAVGVFVVGAVVVTVLAFPSGDAIGVLMPAYAAVTYTFVGMTVLWRRPGHGIGRLALGIGVVFAVGGLVTLIGASGVPGFDPAGLPTPVASILEAILSASSALPTIGLVLGVSLLVLWFPDGRRTSALGGFVEIALVASLLLVAASSAGLVSFGSDVAIAALAASVVLSLVDLIRRFRRADPQRRTQMKPVLAAMVVNVALMAFVMGPASGDPRFDWAWAAWLLSMGLPILAIAVGITRYHLYDIDRIVSRSIAYVVVSVVLFALFSGVNLALQWIISPLFSGTAIAVAASTLVVAASFAPLARAVQRVVDRRFNRSRHDADQVLAAFGGRLRDELDLQTVARELQGTAARAVEPSASAVWLRMAGSDR